MRHGSETALVIAALIVVALALAWSLALAWRQSVWRWTPRRPSLLVPANRLL